VIKLLVILALVGCVVSDNVRSMVADAAQPVLSLVGIGDSAGEEAPYDSLCPLLDGYFATTGDAKEAAATAVSAVATDAAASADPALSAVMSVVPAALRDDGSDETASARDLLGRECKAHKHALANG
jgi:hypothetical protein